MNEKEILNIPAGKEMDALIVEKVLKWELSDRGFYVKEPRNPESYDTPNNFKPSTDIAAAWEVVEKLRIAIIPKPEGETGWLAKWGNENIYSSGGDEDEENPMIGWTENHWFTHVVDADSAPLAICRAALLAITREKK